MAKHYDYIIAGAGCAGMSLLMRMIQEPFFQTKKILVIDQSAKTNNDRTWCFWETNPGIFEPVVKHHWEKVNFLSSDFSKTLDLFPYQYKMISGIDLYTFVKTEAAKHPNIEWITDTILSFEGKQRVNVVTATEIFTASFVFNSILFREPAAIDAKDKNYYLKQHFKGWEIETERNCFDPGVATYMDFRLAQDKGTTFMYVLPVSKTKALVEYTLFSENLLADEEYTIALRKYIDEELKIEKYSITHIESGVIPMTNQRFSLQVGNMVNIGIAGGQVKPSSGYAFRFIQQRAESIIRELVTGTHRFSERSFADKKFHLYDSVLLQVLYQHKIKGEKIFSDIFRKNSAELVFRFLDNQTSILEDLRIMQSVPTHIFLPAALKEMVNKIG